MAKNPEYLCSIEGGGKCIAYHKEQTPEFKNLKKHFVHFMTDDMHPVIGDDGKPKTGLKSSDKLRIIGYTD